MIERLLEIHPIIAPHIDAWDEKVQEDMPTYAEMRELKRLHDALSEFNDVSQALQKGDPFPDLLTVREYFDALMELFPVTERYLGSQSRVVHSPWFESAIIKVLRNCQHLLDMREINALKQLRVPDAAAEEENGLGDEEEKVAEAQAPRLSVVQRIQARKSNDWRLQEIMWLLSSINWTLQRFLLLLWLLSVSSAKLR
jgi:hypothetical protein